ncbi:MAG: hypothetical protein JXR63_13455 [Spirochaetales bacterium]|nr:hypothetical protein [Spirochaetales bacterium]
MKKCLIILMLVFLFACGEYGAVQIGEKVFSAEEAARLEKVGVSARKIMDNYSQYESPEMEMIELLKAEFGDDYYKYYEAVELSSSNSRGEIMNENVSMVFDRNQPNNLRANVRVFNYKWAWESYVKVDVTFRYGVANLLKLRSTRIIYSDEFGDGLNNPEYYATYEDVSSITYRGPSQPGYYTFNNMWAAIVSSDIRYLNSGFFHLQTGFENSIFIRNENGNVAVSFSGNDSASPVFDAAGIAYSADMVCGALNDLASLFVMPTLGGYEIDEVIPFAFSGHRNLESLVLPDTISKISKYSFNGLSSLRNLTIYAEDPPFVERSFGGSDRNLCLNNLVNIYVPATSLDAYKTAEGWSHLASRIFAIQ